MSKKSTQNKVIAVIDIGSNEINMKIGQNIKGKLKILENLSYPLKLGRDTFNYGKISFEKADKACDIVKNYLKCAAGYGADKVRAIATSAFREAENRDYILDQIRLKTGVLVEVIDSKEEKFYIFKLMLGLLNKEQKQSSLMVHIGSGNLGISLLEKEKIPFVHSIRIGSLRISELFENVHEYSKNFHVVVEEYLNSFTDCIEPYLPGEIDQFLATGNEVEVIGKICGAENKNSVLYIRGDKFELLYDDIKHKTVKRISEDYNISAEKAEVLLPAMCIYGNLFKLTRAEYFVLPLVSLGDALLKEELYPEEFEEINREFNVSSILSAKTAARRFKSTEGHFARAEKFSLKIFDKIKKIHGLGAKERLLLQASSILHDIGKFVSIQEHYRHSYNIIRSLDILGLNMRDMDVVANISLYHSRIVPSMNDENYRLLSPGDRVVVSKLAAILRIADSLDSSHKQKFDEIDVKLTDDELLILVQTDRNIDLEQWSFVEKANLFEEVFGIKAQLKRKR